MKDTTTLINQIRQELKQNKDVKYREDTQRFFKEQVSYLGVRTPTVRQIGRKYWPKIKNLTKEEVFELCERLLDGRYNEEKTIAFEWAFRVKRQYEKQDFARFERWLKQYVTNWGLCDDFCTHALGELVFQYPKFISQTYGWSESKNRWLRRASAVVLIYSIRRKDILKESFRVAESLLDDEDDLVQKGYGWLLKEAANCYQQPVFEFVMTNRKDMPRTALRYAIEKMPERLRQKAMV